MMGKCLEGNTCDVSGGEHAGTTRTNEYTAIWRSTAENMATAQRMESAIGRSPPLSRLPRRNPTGKASEGK
jgi:hypothetical protein